MINKEKVLKEFESWFKELPVHKYSGGPARGTIGAALVVLESLKTDFNLNLEAHRAAGKSQLKGISGAAVAQILANFGEKRPFISEGGRTNRGGPADVARMLDSLKISNLEEFAAEDRNAIIDDLQRFLVEKVRDFHNRQRLKVVYDSSKSTWQSIYDLLALARETGKEGQVAQYLVGAKLQLRFPDVVIENKSYSTADDQLGRPGDFLVGDTSFHVTVAPMPAIYEKCKRNIAEGYRVFLLVSDRALVGARQNAELTIPDRIAVESIESFIGQNVEELSTFTKDNLADGFLKLLETYNQRVNAIENDKSMLIEIPPNLLHRHLKK